MRGEFAQKKPSYLRIAVGCLASSLQAGALKKIRGPGPARGTMARSASTCATSAPTCVALVCAESPVKWHLDGRAAGFYVGVYRVELNADGGYVALPDRFAYVRRCGTQAT